MNCSPMRCAELPKRILSRDGKMTGTCTGKAHRCQMEGCSGRRLAVKWPNDKMTYPCTKGMQIIDEEVWQII